MRTRLRIPAILHRRSFAFGLALVGIVAIAAGLADLLAPFDPVKNNFRYRLGEPNEVNLLGTDRFGRDVRSDYGPALSHLIGRGLLESNGEWIRPTRRGFELNNEIGLALVA